VLLCMDWTLLRLFPPLRATWALVGTQAVVPITGTNAKRVLFGAIDLRTAHRIVLIRCHARQADAQAFLGELRRRYRRAGQIWLLADRASAHTAPQTLALAAQLRIRFLWLPKQAPELSPMDQLWRELKRLIAANRQAESIDALAADATCLDPDADATAGASQGCHDCEAVLAEKPVAALLATYLVVHPASYAALGRSAMPG
jgi:DDE superfamily endonuclease